jgi:hypothetical protein
MSAWPSPVLENRELHPLIGSSLLCTNSQGSHRFHQLHNLYWSPFPNRSWLRGKTCAVQFVYSPKEQFLWCVIKRGTAIGQTNVNVGLMT